MTRKTLRFIAQLLFFILGFLHIVPIFLTVMNSFKTMPELSKSFLTVPPALHFENYTSVIKRTFYFRALGNSLFVTSVSLIGILLITTMASYAITRRRSKINHVLYIMFVMGMVMPFATIMIPIMKLLGALNMTGTWALIIVYCALGVSMATFVLSGFIESSVPIEMEEAARIDGANSGKVLFYVVMPMLRPALMTLTMLDAIWIWNDYLLPSLLLTRKNVHTIPLSQVFLVGQHLQKWTLQFAGFTLSMLPLFLLFFSCQKYIVSGIAAGAIKG
ncbi:MAG: carbohydrate ABC transporter permease [Ruminococcaceae bacterium]|nr:carbohydrate ABC transporter permease [Oscillospiraceae bacterium]